ncbi:MAG: hypothetical protein FWD44_01285 [Oscillospiraceae bacterium]|nr:hypothetical protein [Oscillospiraceae bacterium]
MEAKSKFLRKAALFFVFIFFVSIVTPVAFARGSIYINSYGAGVTAGNNGSITVSFNITGRGIMDEIGATRILLYENGSLIRTYLNTNTSGMMGYNKSLHASSVTYTGVAGRAYFASVSFKCGKDGGWDTRSLTTNTVTAR